MRRNDYTSLVIPNREVREIFIEKIQSNRIVQGKASTR